MVKVVSKASVLDGLVRLLGKCDDFIIVTIQLGLFDCLVVKDRLQLVSFVNRPHISLLFLTLIPLEGIFVFRCCYEWVLPATGVFESVTVSNLKDFGVVRNLIWDSRIDDHFLVWFDEIKWVRWFLTVKIISINLMVDFYALLFILELLSDLSFESSLIRFSDSLLARFSSPLLLIRTLFK